MRFWRLSTQKRSTSEEKLFGLLKLHLEGSAYNWGKDAKDIFHADQPLDRQRSESQQAVYEKINQEISLSANAAASATQRQEELKNAAGATLDIINSQEEQTSNWKESMQAMEFSPQERIDSAGLTKVSQFFQARLDALREKTKVIKAANSEKKYKIDSTQAIVTAGNRQIRADRGSIPKYKDQIRTINFWFTETIKELIDTEKARQDACIKRSMELFASWTTNTTVLNEDLHDVKELHNALVTETSILHKDRKRLASDFAKFTKYRSKQNETTNELLSSIDDKKERKQKILQERFDTEAALQVRESLLFEAALLERRKQGFGIAKVEDMDAIMMNGQALKSVTLFK